ncbi:MAG: ImmA/IrrE family metallo-endopeptidase, partial [Chloroflexi bacterium]|nr:ImmA/IrrE family metallo-endopeptidase [Chloroflexota bacterium]
KETLLSIFDPSREVVIAKRDIGVIRGLVKPSGDSWIVVVNSKLPNGAQRFALFHEGFHILERSGAIPIEGDDEYHQWLAERFAARILMPHRWVAETSAKITDIKHLCAIFQVSQTAMKRRLQELAG